MGIRVQRRVNLGKGFGLNLSKSGVSTSLRTKAGSISSKGYSIPTGITGLYIRGNWSKGKRKTSSQKFQTSQSSTTGTSPNYFLWIVAFIFFWPVLIPYFLIRSIYRLATGKSVLGTQKSVAPKVDSVAQQIVQAYKSQDFQLVHELAKTYEGSDLEALQCIGHFKMKTGKIEQGNGLFVKAIQLAKDQNDSILSNKIILTQASALYNEKEYSRVITILQTIPEDFNEYYKDIEDYRKAFLLGYSFYYLKMYDVALQSFRKAPVNKTSIGKGMLNDIIIGIAETYEAMGNKKMALKNYEKALGNDFSREELQLKITELNAN